jgi:hypothetical protein
MAKTLHIGGWILMNTSSLYEDGSVVDDKHEIYGYGTTVSDGESIPHITMLSTIDQKPVIQAPAINYTFDDLTDVTGSWNYYSASLSGGLQTALINSSNISQSHFGEVYSLRIQDTESTYYDDEDYDVGDYYKFRDFQDGALIESYLIPVTQSAGPYSIPPWS